MLGHVDLLLERGEVVEVEDDGVVRFAAERVSDEAAAVAALVEAAFARHVAAVGRRPAPMDDDHAARIAAGEQWVRDADDGDGLASSIVLVDNGDHLVVNNVAVRPGPARAAASAASCWPSPRTRPAAAASRRSACTPTRPWRTTSLMYPKLGYTETGRETRGGFHRVLFVKPLA